MKHTGTLHGGGRTAAILRRLTTALQCLHTVCAIELLVCKRKKHAGGPSITSQHPSMLRNNLALANTQSARGEGEQTVDKSCLAPPIFTSCVMSGWSASRGRPKSLCDRGPCHERVFSLQRTDCREQRGKCRGIGDAARRRTNKGYTTPHHNHWAEGRARERDNSTRDCVKCVFLTFHNLYIQHISYYVWKER